jgi:hypothetical protein
MDEKRSGPEWERITAEDDTVKGAGDGELTV